MLSLFGKAGNHILPTGRVQKREQKTERQERKKQTTLSSFLPTASRGMSASTVENYHTAVRSFIRFGSGKDIPLSGIDCHLVARYERWLHEQGVCPNTSSCYLRSLRAIYNKASQHRQVKDRKPFRNLPTGSRLALARDLFIFSFCAMGMPFADMAQLRRGQIKEGVLTYCRRKTGRQVRVKIEGLMQDILDRYAREDSDNLFPILHRAVGKRLQPRRYSTALCGYNHALQRLAQKTGIKAHLSSYVPRHSWASMAYRHNVALPVISQALGHSDTHTTLIYIRGIDDRQVAKANKKLLLEILTPPLGKRCGRKVE